MKNLLCLDFDGVICDSINECLLVAYNSYMKVEGRFDEMVTECNSIAREINDNFYKYRYLVRPARDYWKLIHLLMKDGVEISPAIFQSESDGNESKLNQFEKIFFDTRANMIENDFDHWISMNKIYKEFIDTWEKLFAKHDVYMVTNKNKMAVDAILRSNNIELEDDHIYTRESFQTKNEALRQIAKLNNKRKDEIIFIDDSPDTITETIEEFPKSFLANWGYFQNTGGIQSINKLAEML